METNLLKTMARSAFRAFALCALAGAPILAGCGIDELEGRIETVENRLTELESGMKEQIDGLAELVNGKITVLSSEYDTEKKVWTIILSNGKTINVAEDALGGPKIGISEVDGKKIWTLDGTPIVDADGNNLSVEASAPSIRVSPVTDEWEISADNGKTWLSTGIKAAEGASIFSKVEEDNNFVYFILSDGTRLKVAKDLDSAISVLSGKQFFTAGQTKSIKLELNNIEKVTVNKPDGWRASVSGSELEITAPAAENPYAELSGKVSIVAVGSDGKSSISEVSVEVGNAPVIITVDKDLNVSFDVDDTLFEGDGSEDGPVFSGYAYGAMLLADFNPDTVIENLKSNTRFYPEGWDQTNIPMTTLLNVEALEKGVAYIAWALPVYEDSYTYERIYDPDSFIFTTVYETYIAIEVSNITFEGARLSVSPKGVSSYYGGVIDVTSYSPDNIISDITGGYAGEYTEVYGDYNGSAASYATGWWGDNTFNPGETYVAYAIPTDKGENTTLDDIYSVQFAIPALTAGGSATATISDVTAEVTKVTATVTPGANVYKFYAKYIDENTYNELTANGTTEDKLASDLYSSGIVGTTDPIRVSRTDLQPGDKGWIVALALDKNGKYQIAKKEANAKEMSFSDITVTASVTGLGLDFADIEITGTSDIVSFKYMNIEKTSWEGDYIYGGDLTKTESNLATSDYSPVKKIDAVEGKASVSFSANDPDYNTKIKSGETYKFFVLGIGSDGRPTKMFALEYKPTFPEGKYISKSDPKWTENKSHAPQLSNLKMVDNNTGTEYVVGDITDFPEKPADESKTTTYTLTADVAVGEKCAKYWIHAQVSGSYIKTSGFGDLVTTNVINSYGTMVKAAAGNQTQLTLNEWAGIYRDAAKPDEPFFDILVVWQDTDGCFYQFDNIDICSFLKATE